MAITYPGTPPGSAVDDFNVPTEPEGTPLSSAGTATRNHPELHDDLGNAVEELERWAALRIHNHSGDDEDVAKGGKLDQANTHESADTDTATGIHHTLGPGAHQVAAGNHTHDYNSLPNIPFKICTSTTRPGAPPQGMVIYETDFKCFRQWELHANNVLAPGLNFTADFNTASTTTIGGGGWDISYSSGDTTTGIMATPAGSLAWVEEGSTRNIGLARRTEPASAHTQTDDQVITWMTGDTPVEAGGFFADFASNDKYFRMSDDKQSYLRLRVLDGTISLAYTTTGRTGEKDLGVLHAIDTNDPNMEWRGQIQDRTFTLYKMGELIGTIKDLKLASAKGSNNRGWAVGMEAGGIWGGSFGQVSPGNINWVRIQDVRYYLSANRWTLLPLGAVPTTRLRQSKAQKLIHTGTILEWEEEIEDNFGYFSIANKTEVVVTEPGIYDIQTALQWDSQYVPDIAHVVIMVNGQETTIRDSKFIRGNTYTPGFSQTLWVGGPLRLVEGDRISVKAKYTASGGILNLIFSYYDAPSKVNSRLDVVYKGP